MRTEMMLEVPAVRLDFTKAQLLLLVGMQHSWMGSHQSNNWLQETTLIQDVFTHTGKSNHDFTNILQKLRNTMVKCFAANYDHTSKSYHYHYFILVL